MSYCVNCGVELEKSAIECPLCCAPVLNAFVDEPDEPPAYPEIIFIPPKTSRRYSAFLISMVMLVPNVVCALTNLFTPASGHWAVYVVASSLLLWIIGILPLCMQRHNAYLLLGIDTGAAVCFAFTLSLFHRAGGWFFKLGLPLILALAFAVGLMVYWLRYKKRRWTSVCMAVLGILGWYSLLLEGLLRLYYAGAFAVKFSIIIAVSCVLLMVFFGFIEHNERFRSWLARRFYV